jgi:hypothetical protein
MAGLQARHVAHAGPSPSPKLFAVVNALGKNFKLRCIALMLIAYAAVALANGRQRLLQDATPLQLALWQVSRTAAAAEA